jgi:hypothetical protein
MTRRPETATDFMLQGSNPPVSGRSTARTDKDSDSVSRAQS